jgi:hypothetical protein
MSADMAQHKAIIQRICKFSHPQEIWDLFDQHPFAPELYRRFAEIMTTPATIEECQALIMARLKFSSPNLVWELMDQHRFVGPFYRKLASTMIGEE